MIKKLRVTVDGKSFDVSVEVPDEPAAAGALPAPSVPAPAPVASAPSAPVPAPAQSRAAPASSREIYNNLDVFRSRLLLRPQEITNSPEIIRRLGIISINTAIEVDIAGNVNSTHVLGRSLSEPKRAKAG